MYYTIAHENIDSESKAVLLSYHPRPARYPPFTLFNLDARKVLPDADFEESLVDVVLGDEEGQTSHDDFLVAANALINAPTETMKLTIMPKPCGDYLAATVFKKEDEPL